jgi:hypothetical protein
MSHHLDELDDDQRARFRVFAALQDIEGIVDHTPEELLHVAHWIATGSLDAGATIIESRPDVRLPAESRNWRPAVES